MSAEKTPGNLSDIIFAYKGLSGEINLSVFTSIEELESKQNIPKTLVGYISEKGIEPYEVKEIKTIN